MDKPEAMENLCLTTRYYATCREREKAFTAMVKGMLPARISGPRSFWRDFNRLLKQQAPFDLPVVHIPADPRHCLAFNSPRQVLQAAALTCPGQQEDRTATITRAATGFGLDQIIDRPVRCLSGGEAAKTALAKAWIKAATGRPLVMASPSGWLSQTNSGLLDKVVRRYTNAAIPVTIMAMEGENDSEPFQPRPGLEPGPALKLEAKNLEISLGRPLNTLAGASSFCHLADIRTVLPSPCLVSGDNGQGKSLLAKALAGAVSTCGRLCLECAGKKGPARLIFQDVVIQALMRGCDQILKSGGRLLRQRASAIFRRLESDWMANFSSPPHSPDRLVRIKLALAAVRLASGPPALVLDEPDWGLSRKSAAALAAAIIDQAHKLKIATVLISHKPWWHSLAKSRLEVTKHPGPKSSGPTFTIGLKSIAGGMQP